MNPTAVGGASTTTTGTGASSTTDPALGNESEKQTLGSRILSAVGLSGKKGDETTAAEPTTTAGKDYTGTQPTSSTAATTEEPKDHHYGRDAAVAGGLGAAGAGAYAATRDHDSQAPGESSLGSASTSQPIGSTADRDYAGTQPLSGTTAATEQPQEHHYGRDAAAVGGLGAAGAGTYAATRGHDSQRPEESALGSGAASEPATSTTGSTQPLPGTAATEQPQDHHYGRDAAVVGGLGAAGAGTYAATRDHDSQAPGQAYAGSTSTSQPITTTTNTTTTTGPTMSQTTGAPTSQNESHMGRDAALAGGAGAAGVGAYEASKDTGPASKTIGPHESNVANIMDPRVKPEPEKMQGSGQKDETHYGRDAAVAGGVGAAGAVSIHFLSS